MNIKEFEDKIDRNKIIKGMNKFVTNSINKIINQNSAELVSYISGVNKIQISGSTSKKDFVIQDIVQTSQVDTKVQANFVQKISSQIANDIQNEIKEKINIIMQDSVCPLSKILIDENNSVMVGDIINGLGLLINRSPSAIETFGTTMLATNITNLMKNDNDRITNQLKSLFNLKENFIYNKDDEIYNKFENILSSDNLNKCIKNTEISNIISVSDVNFIKPITGLKQELNINGIMKCAFDQDIMNEISNKIINKIDRLIQLLVENIKEGPEKETMIKNIYAGSVAGKAILAGYGSQGSCGKVLEREIEIEIKEKPSLFKQLLIPILIALLFIAILIIIIIIVKKNSSNYSTNNSDNFDTTTDLNN